MYIHFLSFIFFHVSFIHSRIKILYLAYYILLFFLLYSSINKKIVFSDETKYITNQFGCNVSNFYRYYKVEPNLNKIILNYL